MSCRHKSAGIFGFMLSLLLAQASCNEDSSSRKSIGTSAGGGCKQFTLSVDDLKNPDKVVEIENFFREQLGNLDAAEHVTITTTIQHQRSLSTPFPTMEFSTPEPKRTSVPKYIPTSMSKEIQSTTAVAEISSEAAVATTKGQIETTARKYVSTASAPTLSQWEPTTKAYFSTGITTEPTTLLQTTELWTSSEAPCVVTTIDEGESATGKSVLDKDCYMGMKSGKIPDSAITASSIWNIYHAANRSRLDLKRVGKLKGCWSAKDNKIGEWIQVDLGEPKLVAGVITQGRFSDMNYRQWIKTYKVSCGCSVGNLKNITDDGADKIFDGNSDKNSKVTNKFPQPMTCRYIRIYPQTWQDRISMRLELIRGDCYDMY